MKWEGARNHEAKDILISIGFFFPEQMKPLFGPGNHNGFVCWVNIAKNSPCWFINPHSTSKYTLVNKLQGNVYIYIYVDTISIFATLQLTHIILDAKQTVNPTIRMCFRRSISYFCGCSHVVSISRCKEPVQCRATTIAKKNTPSYQHHTLAWNAHSLSCWLIIRSTIALTAAAAYVLNTIGLLVKARRMSERCCPAHKHVPNVFGLNPK